jgi:hypothetical protein
LRKGPISFALRCLFIVLHVALPRSLSSGSH